ncbi:MAG: hypothetical protein H6510_07340 [Acidobacteria bacterium]|nr:hypothetical protein [Acidobacteriota bacterium]
MKWRVGESIIQDFAFQLNDQGMLESITSAGFALTLTWSETQLPEGCQPTAFNEMPAIIQIVKSVPGYSETWVPTYTGELALADVTMTRSTGTVIHERYVSEDGSLPQQIPVQLVREVDGLPILNLVKQLDASATQIRVGSLQDGSEVITAEYDDLGNLRVLASPTLENLMLDYTLGREVASAQLQVSGSTRFAEYAYDHQAHRISGSDSPNPSSRRIYAYDGSRVIAIGEKDLYGTITWQYAIGHGPLGPVLLKDLTGGGYDYFIFTDHLGTPFGWLNPNTNQVFVTSYSPYGELMASPENRPPPFEKGNVATEFPLPPLPGFDAAPIGLGGHLYDHATGLTYMHHRYLHPRLGHFTTPDFRTPNIYDPSTLTQPYAYARGNAIMFWDLTGLETFRDKYKAGLDELAEEAAFSDSKIDRFYLHGVALGLSFVGAGYEVLNGVTFGSAQRIQEDLDKWENGRIDSDELWKRSTKNFGIGAAGVLLTAATGGGVTAIFSKLSTSALLAETAGGVAAGLAAQGYTDLVAIHFGEQDSFSSLGSYILAGTLGGFTGYAKYKASANGKASVPGDVCFTAGTQIPTQLGFKNIEDIQVGDQVWSKNPVSGEMGYKPVTQLFTTQPTQLVHLIYVKREHRSKTAQGDNQDEEGEPCELIGTPQHRVWSLDDQAWVEISDLQLGERLLLADSQHAYVLSQTLEEAPKGEHFTTYNFAVKDWHTYFAGPQDSQTAIWVHNEGNLCDNGVSKWAKRVGELGAEEGDRLLNKALSLRTITQADVQKIKAVAFSAPNNSAPGNVKFQRWRRGDPIDKPLPDGSAPSWDTVQSRYWKNRFEASKNTGEFTEANLQRMRRGTAPQDFNPRTGKWESRELHHVIPQRANGPNSPINLRELTPDWHAEMDAFRQVPGVRTSRGIR